MAHEIIVDVAARVVRIRYQGQIRLGERSCAIREAMDAADAAEVRRLLVDFREAHCLDSDATACDRMVADWAPRLAGVRVAYLVTHDHQVTDMLENLAEQRGVMVARFRNWNAAMDWLSVTPAPGNPGANHACAADSPSDVIRLTAQVLDPSVPVPPATYAAIGQLVQELLDAGVPEPDVPQLALRISAAIQGIAREPIST